MLAKAVASLSVLTGGRIQLGVGGGAFPDAIAAMGAEPRAGARPWSPIPTSRCRCCAERTCTSVVSYTGVNEPWAKWIAVQLEKAGAAVERQLRALPRWWVHQAADQQPVPASGAGPIPGAAPAIGPIPGAVEGEHGPGVEPLAVRACALEFVGATFGALCGTASGPATRMSSRRGVARRVRFGRRVLVVRRIPWQGGVT